MNTNNDTIKEILNEDDQEIKNGGKKKRGCFARMLIFFIILLIAFLGFIFVQQYLLDIEAEAIVSAAHTSTALANSSDNEEEAPAIPVKATGEPKPTATEDPAFERTATIAVQLTNVAEFQLTITTTP